MVTSEKRFLHEKSVKFYEILEFEIFKSPLSISFPKDSCFSNFVVKAERFLGDNRQNVSNIHFKVKPMNIGKQASHTGQYSTDGILSRAQYNSKLVTVVKAVRLLLQ